MYTKDAKAVVTEEKKKNAMSICDIQSGGYLGRDKLLKRLEINTTGKGCLKTFLTLLSYAVCRERQFTNINWYTIYYHIY